MDEETFLEQLATHPSDETRLVYADWLEEDGQPEKAEFLRMEHRMRTARARVEALIPKLDEAWLGALLGHLELQLLAYPGGVKIPIIKLIRELLGVGLKEAKERSEQLPATVFRGTGRPLLAARERFLALGAQLRLAGRSERSSIIELFGEGGIELLAYPPQQKIAVIKVIREVTGLGLKEAKDMSESLPRLVIEGGEAQLKWAQERFAAVGASVRFVMPSAVSAAAPSGPAPAQ